MAVTIDGTNGINDTVLGSSTPAAANVTTLGASGEVTATGFTGTLDGILGSGTPAAATVTTLAASGDLTANNFAGRNKIINGAMVIDQRNAGAVITPSNAYTVDRFWVQNSQASKLTAQQNAGSVTLPVGFINYLGITSSSAYSVGSGDYFNIQQSIEGVNCGGLAWGTSSAATVTLSFRVYSSLTGTFGGSLRNSANNRSYPFTYTVSSANTWTTISLTIVGDQSGTWLTTTGVGINILFNLGTGTTYSGGTANAWNAGNYNTPSGSVSVVGTSGATFYITGVQLEKSSTATEFEHRNFGEELALCQRYFEKVAYEIAAQDLMSFFTATTGNGIGIYQFKVTKRALPTNAYSALSDFICYGNTYGSNTPNGLAMVSSTRDVAINPTIAATNFLAQGASLLRLNGSGGFLTFSAEL